MAEKKTKSSKTLYFSYGSNMNSKQLNARCSGKPAALAVAKLEGHKVAFFGHSKTWDGAVETVISAPGHEAWGVVYELSLGDRDKLDDYQDIRLDGTGSYFQYPSEVEGADSKRYSVLFYKKDLLGEPQKPSQEYLDFIVEGAVERGLPASYVDELRGIEAQKASYPVPFVKKTLREAMGGAPCDCGDLRASMGGPGLKPPKKG